jgi:hypothetical protein
MGNVNILKTRLDPGIWNVYNNVNTIVLYNSSYKINNRKVLNPMWYVDDIKFILDDENKYLEWSIPNLYNTEYTLEYFIDKNNKIGYLKFKGNNNDLDIDNVLI